MSMRKREPAKEEIIRDEGINEFEVFRGKKRPSARHGSVSAVPLWRDELKRKVRFYSYKEWKCFAWMALLVNLPKSRSLKAESHETENSTTTTTSRVTMRAQFIRSGIQGSDHCLLSSMMDVVRAMTTRQPDDRFPSNTHPRSASPYLFKPFGDDIKDIRPLNDAKQVWNPPIYPFYTSLCLARHYWFIVREITTFCDPSNVTISLMVLALIASILFMCRRIRGAFVSIDRCGGTDRECLPDAIRLSPKTRKLFHSGSRRYRRE